MREMRRKDRQVTDMAEIRRVLDECHVCRVGFYDGAEVYVVPLNFGYVEREGKLTLYFHSAREGRKTELFRAGGSVGFELDCGHELVRNQRACEYTELFKSVIGTGRPREVAEAEKLDALRTIMAHYGAEAPEFDPAMVARVACFAIEAEAYTCKEHL